LLRRSDGLRRMCVNYMALNKKIMMDKFSIPVVERLVNEIYDS
jgi:hypothetical protein